MYSDSAENAEPFAFHTISIKTRPCLYHPGIDSIDSILGRPPWALLHVAARGLLPKCHVRTCLWNSTRDRWRTCFVLSIRPARTHLKVWLVRVRRVVLPLPTRHASVPRDLGQVVSLLPVSGETTSSLAPLLVCLAAKLVSSRCGVALRSAESAPLLWQIARAGFASSRPIVASCYWATDNCSGTGPRGARLLPS